MQGRNKCYMEEEEEEEGGDEWGKGALRGNGKIEKAAGFKNRNSAVLPQ